MIYNLQKSLIDLFCAISPSDALTLEITRICTMQNKPLAASHLVHYVNGQGVPRRVNTRQLLTEDRNVRNEVYNRIGSGMTRDAVVGTIPVSQAIYSNQDWRYALGGISLDWDLHDDWVRLRFIDRYRWHPDDTRLTQSIHRAAENLKRFGAREFSMIGATVMLPVVDILSHTARKITAWKPSVNLL